MKFRFRKIYLLAAALCTAAAALAASPAQSLISDLAATVRQDKVLFGHHDDPVYGHDWTGESGRSDILEAVGAYPAVMSWDFGGIENGKELNLDGVPFYRMRKEAVAQNARGGINTFSWHPTMPGGEGSSWIVDDPTVVNRIINDPKANEWFVSAVGRIADFFNSLKDEKGNDIPVIFRPWHELTGSWFWWGNDLCSADDYKSLWKLTRSVMDSKGVDNVVWAYSPDRVKSLGQYLDRYPGDEFVDIMGTDVYHFNGAGGTRDYLADAAASLDIVKEAAARHGKLMAFTETGCEGIPVNNWFTAVLLPILKRYPVAYVTVWRNAFDNKNHYYTPYAGHPAMNDFISFSNDPAVVFVKPGK